MADELGVPAQVLLEHRLSLIVISPNAAYRRALAAILRKQPGMRIEAHRSSVSRAVKESPHLQPDVTIVDCCAVNDVVEAKKAWPDTVLICLLDYIGDWDYLKSLGADGSVLKDSGVTAIIDLLDQLGEAQPTGIRIGSRRA